MLDKFLLMGSLGKPFKLEGALHFYPINRDSRLIQKGSAIYVEGKKYLVQEINYAHQVTIKLQGVLYNDCSLLVNKELYILKSDLPRLENSYYLFELLGYSLVDEEQHSYGVIDSFYENGDQIVLVAKKLEIPFHPFVLQVDRERRVVLIRKVEWVE